jgi:hypothetical protein
VNLTLKEIWVLQDLEQERARACHDAHVGAYCRYLYELEVERLNLLPPPLIPPVPCVFRLDGSPIDGAL